MRSYRPNLKSLAQTVLKIFWIDLGQGPFWGKLFVRLLCFPKTKLFTKFEVHSSSSFEDMVDCMPKILGVTWPKPGPYWEKLFARPLGFSKMKLCTKFEVPSSSSFEDMIDRMAKILEVTWPKPRPFWENICAPARLSQVYQIWSPQLK